MIEKEIWQRFKDKGLKVIAIGVQENDEKTSFWSSHHQLTYPVISDIGGETYKNYGTGFLPYHVLIDRYFRIRLSQENFKKGLLIRMIRNTLEGANPSLRRRISAKLLGELFTLIRKTRS